MEYGAHRTVLSFGVLVIPHRVRSTPYKKESAHTQIMSFLPVLPHGKLPAPTEPPRGRYAEPSDSCVLIAKFHLTFLFSLRYTVISRIPFSCVHCLLVRWLSLPDRIEGRPKERVSRSQRTSSFPPIRCLGKGMTQRRLHDKVCVQCISEYGV